MKIIENIDYLEEEIYSIDQENINSKFIDLITSLENEIIYLKNDIELFNDILNNLYLAYTNKDYILLFDILESNLRPFIEKNMCGE